MVPTVLAALLVATDPGVVQILAEERTLMTLKNPWDYLLLANLEINPLRHLTPWWTRSSTRSATRDQIRPEQLEGAYSSSVLTCGLIK